MIGKTQATYTEIVKREVMNSLKRSVARDTLAFFGMYGQMIRYVKNPDGNRGDCVQYMSHKPKGDMK